MRKKIFIISSLCLITVAIFLWFSFSFKTNNTDEYLAFDSELILENYDIYSYGNGYYVIHNGEKYALIDSQGNEKLPFKYDYIEVLDDYILTLESSNNDYTLYDFNFDVVFSKIQMGETTTCLDHKYVFYQNDKAFLIDDKKNHLLDNYDAIHCENDLIIASRDDYNDIYDKDLNELFTQAKVGEITDQYSNISTLTNANFLLLKVQDGYQVYVIKSHILSPTFSYVSLNEDLIAGTINDTIKIYDANLKEINNFSKTYADYQIINQNILAIPNKKCNNKYQDFSYYDLYDQSNTKLTNNDCNNVLIDTDYTVVKDEADLFTVYDDKGIIFTYQGTNGSYLYPVANQKFHYLDEASKVHLLNINGEDLYPNCQGQIDELADDIYLCSSNTNLYYIYQNNKLMWNHPYQNISYHNGFYIVENGQNLYGLYGKLGNQILEEKYDQITIYNDDLLIIKLNDQTIIRPLKLVDRKTYFNFLKENHNLNIEKKENKIEDIDTFINDYDLTKQKDLILNNEDLFKTILYHTENNSHMTKQDKKYFYSLFASIVDYAQFNKIDKLLAKLDTLVIKTFKNRPSDMRDFSAGEYHSYDNTIYILETYYDYVIRHELMHFISFSLSDNQNIYYTCQDKILDYNDMFYLSIEKQNDCTSHFVLENTFLEEAGAEYFTHVVYQNLSYEAYPKSNIAYNLLQYILQDNFLEIQYSNSKEIALAKKLNDKLGLNDNEITILLNSLHNLNQVEQELVPSYAEQNYNLAKSADELINLYELTKGISWQNNDYVALAIKSILNNLDIDSLISYLKSNNDVKIDHLNDFKNISLIDPLTNILKTLDSSFVNVNYYFMNEDLNFKIRFNFNSQDNFLKTIDVFINPEGNIINSKVIE